jgi:hypothetical protein
MRFFNLIDIKKHIIDNTDKYIWIRKVVNDTESRAITTYHPIQITNIEHF